MNIENDLQERYAVNRIAEKIRREGRKSLTTQEENIYSYSRFGNGGGCPSSPPAVVDVSEHINPPCPN
jgi:hypothetical protein